MASPPPGPYTQLSAKEANSVTALATQRLSEEEVTPLIRAAFEARAHAYCPYSKFAVGAALLAEDGSVVKGCNVENISFGLTICAERTAIGAAVAQGLRRFRAIAIVADQGETFVGPCGACRQVLGEFGTGLEVYLARPSGHYMVTTVKSFLPDSFTPETVSLPC